MVKLAGDIVIDSLTLSRPVEGRSITTIAIVLALSRP